MGGQTSSTQQQIPPLIQQGMNNLDPGVADQLSAITPPKPVDPMAYSDPTNTPDPLIEAIKWLSGYGSKAAPSSAPKRR